MPRVRLAAVPLLAGLLPLTAGALGLGEISLRSALNQPFVAEIPVTAESPDELNQLSVQLAPAATFERFGLDRPRFLDDLNFQVQREGSRAVVRVTSTQPVSEPFISLLLDVGWPQGRLLREYTVLLDPPAFAGGSQSAPSPAAAPPAAAGPAAPAPVIRREPAAPPAARSEAPAGGSITSGPDGDTYGPVRSNETLWGISERLRADSSVSLNQMMVAIYRANPEAFAGNINRLRRGAILRVPAGSEVAVISGREAASEVQRQDEAWRSAATAESAEPARLELVPPAEESAGAGAGSGQGTVPSGDKAALQRELAEKQRLLSVKDGQLKALQDRVSQLEGRTPAAPLATPADVPPAAAAPPATVVAPAELPVDTAPESPAAAPEVPADSTAAAPVAADEPAPAERKPARRPASERSKGGGFLSSVTGLLFNVWFLVAAAAGLLAGLFLVFGRRRMAASDQGSSRFDNDLRGDMRSGAASTQPLVRRDGYSVEEGAADRTQVTGAPGRASARDADADTETPLERTISTEGAVELDQADVVAEADFHMAYGLYDQAAELLTRALRDSPDRRDLRLKLLEVYFIWENKAAFLKEAQTFQRQQKGASDPDWNKVVIMGKQICPGEALFAGAVGATGDVGIDLGVADDQGGVDISFDEGEADGLDLDLTAARQGPSSDLLDFDLGTADEGAAGGQGRTSSTEGPTIEAPYGGDYSPTMETPTIESRGLGAATMETPTIETPTVETAAGGGTLETPTLESAVPGLRPGAADSRRQGGGDQTEEINLEDLGLDLTGLDEAAGELGTGVHDAIEGADTPADEDFVFDIGSTEDDDGSDLLQGLDADSTAEMRGMALDEGTLDLPAFSNAMEKSAAGRATGRDSTGDTAEHRVVDDTAEQPRAAPASLGDASAELSQVDFDIGDDKAEDLEPTSVMTGRRRGPEGPTMTEVGTKLDLARAYVDMGDPDGARSILNEVLEEGDSAQRQEARRLLDDLTD
ncbi:MAG: FimV/HubP family polar landmark protein [Gammaproteobacteria bacterium]